MRAVVGRSGARALGKVLLASRSLVMAAMASLCCALRLRGGGCPLDEALAAQCVLLRLGLDGVAAGLERLVGGPMGSSMPRGRVALFLTWMVLMRRSLVCRFPQCAPPPSGLGLVVVRIGALR